jgi:hypothetical protein
VFVYFQARPVFVGRSLGSLEVPYIGEGVLSWLALCRGNEQLYSAEDLLNGYLLLPLTKLSAVKTFVFLW